MKFLLSCYLVFAALGLVAQDTYTVNIDLVDVQDDRIKVRIKTPALNTEEIRYVMPWLVPGVYARDPYGQFIEDFQALDAEGKPLKTKRKKKNSWTIQEAKRLHSIEYWVGDSWDNFNFIFRAGGTNIEANKHFMLNMTGIFGYLEGYKQWPYTINIVKPEAMYGATAMHVKSRGTTKDQFYAPNYVELADQPLMYCHPDTVQHQVGNTVVDVAVFSQNGVITAEMINSIIEPLTHATQEFLGELPVEHYQYLFVFVDDPGFPSNFLMGALEHSNSSVYFLSEREMGWGLEQSVRSIAAHEFLHILTPLNLHSELIADFSFHEPKMSQHLWLYEGVTEYFSELLQLQTGLITDYGFRRSMQRKIINAEEFRPYSLTQMSLESLEGKTLIAKAKKAKLYGDIYEKGAVVAFMLDIRINELTNGEKDLLSVIQTLMQRYGKDQPFSEANFIDDFIATAHPDLRPFFDDYIIGVHPMPYAEYMAKIGWTYHPKGERYLTSCYKTRFGYNPEQDKYSIYIPGKNTLGLERGDVLLSLNRDTSFSADHLVELLYPYSELPVEMKILRGGQEMVLSSSKLMKQKLQQSIVLLNTEANEAQLALRKMVLSQSS